MSHGRREVDVYTGCPPRRLGGCVAAARRDFSVAATASSVLHGCSREQPVQVFFVWFDCDKSPGGCYKTADIDEKSIRKEKPEELVMVLAEAKADAIMSKLKASNCEEHEEPTLLITADQVVVHGEVIREKPSSKDEARQFIKGYSGGHAATVGSVVVTNLKTGVRRGGWDKAEIYFHAIPDEVVESLIEEGTVLYVAGGLMVEHPLTSPFVNAVVGTIDSVMGLSKDLTQKLIQEVL
ncbi:hypothetical protein Taro_016781 [Colocasia esculenta]|uniref:Maf-like protein n=1 Tax=Colocasia esculenta TaxID=4460 RepID=A0A843UL95_COLES|nr:hypothetical protein [Colocasia esculenta]